MPSINISEDDFGAVANAARDARDAGHMDEAHQLDKIARKMNAALSNGTLNRISPFGRVSKAATWRDMPSTIGD